MSFSVLKIGSLARNLYLYFMHSIQDELFMRRALELAELGRGNVSPNPLVGCLIVDKTNKIIGEGYHQQYGGPHAEVNAINSVENKENFQDAILYVTLEPCSHHGKTPPCADLIIKYPFKKVVICNVDTNPLVGGKGIKRIEEHGIEVVSGVLEEAGRSLNKRFFTFIEKKRPYIILKWAQTKDGFVARGDYSSKWISNSLSRKLVHQWRSEEQAIMVGTNTVIHDNPKLNVREWEGKNPIRIFIDKDLKIGSEAYVLDQTQRTICYNLHKNESAQNLEYVKVDRSKSFLDFILYDLFEKNIQSVIVEGGSNLLQAFISEKKWDEARVFTSLNSFEEGIPSPDFIGKMAASEKIESDDLTIFQPLY